MAVSMSSRWRLDALLLVHYNIILKKKLGVGRELTIVGTVVTNDIHQKVKRPTSIIWSVSNTCITWVKTLTAFFDTTKN